MKQQQTYLEQKNLWEAYLWETVIVPESYQAGNNALLDAIFNFPGMDKLIRKFTKPLGKHISKLGKTIGKYFSKFGKTLVKPFTKLFAKLGPMLGNLFAGLKRYCC
jgi:hypothetical protein